MRHAVFLRGMNVGGHRITNEELRSHFEAMGFDEAKTFRASGNVVLSAGRESPSALATRVELRLAQALGYPVAVFLRSAGQIRQIAARQPFSPAQLSASAGKPQVALLRAAPSARARADTLERAGEGEGVCFAGRELYWLPSAGVLSSGLDMAAIERLLGAMTMRTKATVEQMAGRYFAD